MNAIMERTPAELIRKLIAESKPDGGSIFLNDFCDQLPNTPRAEAVATLKNNKDVLFIVGRKGHMSRVVFGRMKDDYHQAPSFKSPLASGPIRRHVPQRVKSKSQTISVSGAELNPAAFRLRVMVQGQTVFVPIDGMELVPA